ncbi:MAG: hypothetical protein R3F43_12070 [bacterium]
MAELDALGPVRHVVKLSDSHGADEPWYLDRYRPTWWTLPGARLGERSSGATLGPASPYPAASCSLPGDVRLARGGLAPAHGRARSSPWTPSRSASTTTSPRSWAGRVSAVLGYRGGVVVPAPLAPHQKVKPGPGGVQAIAALAASRTWSPAMGRPSLRRRR